MKHEWVVGYWETKLQFLLQVPVKLCETSEVCGRITPTFQLFQIELSVRVSVQKTTPNQARIKLL
jgi:hypothetical protein